MSQPNERGYETQTEELSRLRLLCKYDANHNAFQNAEIRKWKCITAALIRQIEGLQQTAEVDDIDLEADPPEIRTQRHEISMSTYLFVDKG